MPLSESGMRNHPLTPMTDANLVRVLRQQAGRQAGLVDHATVSRGAATIRARFAALREQGHGFAVVDALSDADLDAIGAACADLPLVTGGSGIVLGLPHNFRRSGLLEPGVVADALPKTGGLRAVISGSCSVATQRQVEVMRASFPSFNVDPIRLARGEDVVSAALDRAGSRIGREPVLIYATATPDAVRQVQAELGAEQAAFADAGSRQARRRVTRRWRERAADCAEPGHQHAFICDSAARERDSFAGGTCCNESPGAKSRIETKT
jgi:uncharacterized protein YgbK (DUF1537 family)